MSLSDAYVEVSCDGCALIEVVRLTPTAGHAWDERNVEARLKAIGWWGNGTTHYCEDCREKHHL